MINHEKMTVTLDRVEVLDFRLAVLGIIQEQRKAGRPYQRWQPIYDKLGEQLKAFDEEYEKTHPRLLGAGRLFRTD